MQSTVKSLVRDDFIWEHTDEPHATRRRQILAKYPQMKQLFGYDWRVAIQFFMTVVTQIFMAYMVRNMSITELVILTYVVSGTLNHSLSVGLHEISHNLVFGQHRPVANRILGIYNIFEYYLKLINLSQKCFHEIGFNF